MAQTLMLVDTSKCTGCRGCQVACKEWNDLKATKTRMVPGTYQNPPAISASTWTVVSFIESSDEQGVRWLFRKQQCLHCGQASCVEVCPTGAMAKHLDGFVEVDEDWCIGCRYCVQACPFGAVQLDPSTGTVRKCTLCIDRVQAGLEPACVKTCPNGALSFGERDNVLGMARNRVESLVAGGNRGARIYGQNELDGLKVAYVLKDRPATYGLDPDPKVATSSVAVAWLSGLVASGVLAVLPFWYLFKRRREVTLALEREGTPSVGGE
ncbi:MAG: 4Fe-4S dicluster domain-containing protein [Chloroflexi bacterium]|nr:4Fe-4S dicluster domain-containing protein [Chloroflexota bacterium]